ACTAGGNDTAVATASNNGKTARRWKDTVTPLEHGNTAGHTGWPAAAGGSEAVVEAQREVAATQVVLAEVVRRADARERGVVRRRLVTQVLHLGVHGQVVDAGVAQVEIELVVGVDAALHRSGSGAGLLVVATGVVPGHRGGVVAVLPVQGGGGLVLRQGGAEVAA